MFSEHLLQAATSLILPETSKDGPSFYKEETKGRHTEKMMSVFNILS
jgi:hypothetical protein